MTLSSRRQHPTADSRRARGGRTARIAILTVLLALGAFAARAQERTAPATSAEPVDARSVADHSVDPYDSSRPAGALRSYIDAARRGDYVAAAKFLDLSSIDGSRRSVEGPKLARHLKVVLDRELWVRYELMSTDPQGKRDDGLPPDLDRVEGQGNLDVYLQRVPAADGSRTWKFSAGTVARIPALYAQYGYGPLGEILPAAMFELRFLEIQLWQWVGLLLLVLLSWVAARIGVWVLRTILRPLVRRTSTEIDDRLVELASPPSTLALALGVFAAGAYLLKLSRPVHELLGGVEKALAVVAVTWIVFRVVDILAAVADERLDRAGRKTAAAVIPLLRRGAKAFLVAVALIGVLQNLGWNVTGLIAGLGVGGIAFALAAQKSIENLFGGVTLIADQPVRVGDFCRFGSGTLGTVEAIGLRSTRIRTLDRTVVTVPNSQFSEIQLESFAPRDRIRLLVTLGVRYETTPDQLRWILAEMRRILLAHPRTTDTPSRVRFVGFGASSLDLEVFTYVTTTDWDEYCAIREDLYLRFMDAVERSGSGFAFPSQTLYLGRDSGLEPELSRAAEAEVDGLRREGRLPFPDFAAETVEQLRGSGDWPPQGSASHPPANADPGTDEHP